MEDMSYDGNEFIGAYNSLEELTSAAAKYTEKQTSVPDLFFREVELNGEPERDYGGTELVLKPVYVPVGNDPSI